MSEQQNMNVSVNDILASAQQAEAVGVPVNWKELCYKVLNVANNYIAMMEAQVQAQKEVEPAPEGE